MKQAIKHQFKPSSTDKRILVNYEHNFVVEIFQNIFNTLRVCIDSINMIDTVSYIFYLHKNTYGICLFIIFPF